MTWASHTLVGASFAKIFGLSYAKVTFGAILPDLAENFIKTKHRGVTHSVTLSLVILVAMWWTPLRDIWIGVMVGHLLMDAMTVMGVPILDEKSRRITLLGGRVRTGSASEYAIAGLIAFIAFVILGSININTERRDWNKLYRLRTIDKKEYLDNRFHVF